jgi:hypothetical protein
MKLVELLTTAGVLPKRGIGQAAATVQRTPPKALTIQGA